MTQNLRLIDASPQEVFDILSDGWNYATWVVGAARIRDVDEGWPAPQSRIHHSVGVWPLLIDDTTQVGSSLPPNHLELIVRSWPTGEGTVRITCERKGRRTLVTMAEDTRSRRDLALLRPARDLLLYLRNAESLRRLAYLAEGRRDGAGHKGTRGTR